MRKFFNNKRYTVVFFLFLSIIFLYFLPVDDISFTICPFFNIVHLQCPLCGITRSIHYALHMQLSESLHHHFLGMFCVFFVIFLICTLLIKKFYDIVHSFYVKYPKIIHAGYLCIACILIVYSVVRNI